MRALLDEGLPLQRPLLSSLAWIVGITVVVSALACTGTAGCREAPGPRSPGGVGAGREHP